MTHPLEWMAERGIAQGVADPPELGEVDRWRGKRLEDMTREELIGALKMAGRLLQSAHASHSRTLATWDLCRKARHG